MDDQELFEKWKEFFEEAMEEASKQAVRDTYEEILRVNLDQDEYLDELPDEGKDALVEMAAEVYTEQFERLLDSTYIDDRTAMLAQSTAFLRDSKRVNLGAKAQGLVEVYWEQASEEAREYGKDQYREWAVEALTDPWPPSDFERERVERFKPPQDDRTFQ